MTVSPVVITGLVESPSVTGTLFLVNMNESDSPDCCKLGLNVPPHCTVKELYPLISSTVLALEDTDTLNVGTACINI